VRYEEAEEYRENRDSLLRTGRDSKRIRVHMEQGMDFVWVHMKQGMDLVRMKHLRRARDMREAGQMAPSEGL
jgi:hypothetical protein